MHPDAPNRLVLLTGPSGAGRSTALNALEDMGFETIDNLPLAALERRGIALRRAEGTNARGVAELALTLAILQAGLTADEGVEKIASGEYTRVEFNSKMPAYITYFTMGTTIYGEMATFKDIYDRDAPVLAAFEAPRKANRSRVTDEEIIEIVNDPRDIA